MEVSKFISECDNCFLLYESPAPKTTTGYERVYREARAQISDPKLVFAAVVYLKQKLVILYHHKALNYLKYMPVLDSIRETARTAPTNLTELSDINWEQLIHIIIKNRGELHFFSNEQPSFLDDRLHTFAFSYLNLKSIGIDFVERDYKFYVSEESHQFIDDMIDRFCRTLGGEVLFSKLAERIGRTYNSAIGRFMEYRHVSVGLDKVRSAIPFGYLISIASKYAGISGNDDAACFENLISLVTELIVVYEIQPQNQFEAMYLESDALIDFIKENILYDGLVGIMQTKVSYASNFIKFLRGKFADSEYASFGVKVRDLARVANVLISLANTKRFTNVQMKDVVLKTGIAEFKIRKILDLLSQQSNIVNAKLRFPPSSLAIDHYFKPVIKIGNNYKIFPKSIAALGCLNTVCNSITNPNGKWSNPLDSELGYAVEDFLRNAFISKGIKIFNGDRAGGESDLEADLICETDDTIFIFEIKKKGLTRQAQAGDEVKLLIDLADSVLATHVQAMRIENILNNHETLTLVDKETVHHLRLSERTVQRISVSLHDFGALQDKTVLQRLLTIATHTDMRHPVSSEDKKLEKWRSNSKELRRLAEENGEIGVAGRMPFHNSLFMSIPQIIMILEQSENEFDFFKHVKSFVSSSTGSRDTYTEFVNRLNFIKRCKAEGLAI